MLKINKLLVLDLEATCWNNEEERGNQISEIIEIGILTIFPLEKNKIVKQEKRIFTIPRHSQISEFCTQLTGIDKDMIKKNGVQLQDAFNTLKKEYGSQNAVWMSWGDYDKNMIQISANRLNVDNPFQASHINLKVLFSMLMGFDKGFGVTKALTRLGLAFEGTQHSGADDAYNTARIWVKLQEIFRKGHK